MAAMLRRDAINADSNSVHSVALHFANRCTTARRGVVRKCSARECRNEALRRALRGTSNCHTFELAMPIIDSTESEAELLDVFDLRKMRVR